MSTGHVLALDQGTTSTRAVVVGPDGRLGPVARRKLPQRYPEPGRVEHDPEGIWRDAAAVLREAVDRSEVTAEEIAALGITNQRETTVLWERTSGRPIHPAIVWQDRRTADACRRLREEGVEPEVRERTGLLLDPYFSATKIAWILDHVEGARPAAERGDIAFGTVDSWLLWRLTGGRIHATDATNASRTLLFDLETGTWDPAMLELFDVPAAVLPEIRPSSGVFGRTDPEVLGTSVPVAGVAGDQHAATFGQAAFEPGMVKATYGTGGFLLLNTGDRPVRSEHRLLTTVAWRIGGETTYALEGSIFSAGATVGWLEEGLGILGDAARSAELAAAAEGTGGVYLVPGFTGLGAPHWDAEARGALLGLTRDTGREEVARAALEAVAYQTRDLLEAMAADGAGQPVELRVDGGLSTNDWAMAFLADMLDLPVERPVVSETTVLGAAYLAGLAVGVHDGLGELTGHWRRERRWEPRMDPGRRSELYGGWKRALGRVLSGNG